MSLEPLETSITWENARCARSRLVCSILEKVEVGLELKNERGVVRSSAGIVSINHKQSDRNFVTPFDLTNVLHHCRRYRSEGYY